MSYYNFTVNNKIKERIILKSLLKRIDSACAQELKFRASQPPRKIIIIVVSSKTIRSLNKFYRHHDCATDALVFHSDTSYQRRRPQTGRRMTQNFFDEGEDKDYLGEIILCPEYVRKQARLSRQPFSTLLSRALAHAILHAEGYDHEKSRVAARRMFKLEDKILARLGMEHKHRF